jgi:hypothetical protein
MQAVLLFPVENAVSVSLIEMDDEGNPQIIGSCDLKEIVDMLPDNLMDLMK